MFVEQRITNQFLTTLGHISNSPYIIIETVNSPELPTPVKFFPSRHLAFELTLSLYMM